MENERVCSFVGCLSDHRVLEKSRPEVSDGRGVVDLEDVELLGNLTVELKFLSLESMNDLLTKVNGDKVLELGNLDDFTLNGLKGVSEVACITRVLEESSHGGLSSVEVVKVSLGGLLLVDELGFLFDDSLSRCDGSGNGLEIENLSLSPVEHINEGVLHLVTSSNELVLERGVVGVVENKVGGAHVYVGS